MNSNAATSEAMIRVTMIGVMLRRLASGLLNTLYRQVRYQMPAKHVAIRALPFQLAAAARERRHGSVVEWIKPGLHIKYLPSTDLPYVPGPAPTYECVPGTDCNGSDVMKANFWSALPMPSPPLLI